MSCGLTSDLFVVFCVVGKGKDGEFN
uniref:Uncharacterized protein n=1 Tax=Anguilla anguilla TaxID=7936 RepID=A0A0E9Q360_ANGAN